MNATHENETTINTRGGAYVGGDASIEGGDLVGRDKIVYGYTPDEFSSLAARIVNLVWDIPEARSIAFGAKTSLENTRRQLKHLAEYKDTHDLLQQLELNYRVLYDMVYEREELLPSEQVPWRFLAGSRTVLQTTILKLCTYVQATSFSSDAMDWVQNLQESHSNLQIAFAQRDVVYLDIVLANINDVIGSQTSRLNDRLIGAVDAVGLIDLVQALRSVHEDLVLLGERFDNNIMLRLDKLAKDIFEFSAIVDRLVELRNEHDRWQQIDNELRYEQAFLSLDPKRFKRRWEGVIGKKLLVLCSVSELTWAGDLKQIIEKIEIALAEEKVTIIIESFHECRSVVIQRFNQVDYELKWLCSILKEAGGPLDSMLERLA